VKGMLPTNYTFEAGERLILLQIGLFSSTEETHVSVKGKPSISEAGTCSSLLPCENLFSV
jgi:hypothetical protein